MEAPISSSSSSSSPSSSPSSSSSCPPPPSPSPSSSSPPPSSSSSSSSSPLKKARRQEILALFPEKFPDLDLQEFDPTPPTGSPGAASAESPRLARLRARKKVKERREIISLFDGTEAEAEAAATEEKQILQELRSSCKKKLTPEEEEKLEEEKRKIRHLFFVEDDADGDANESSGEFEEELFEIRNQRHGKPSQEKQEDPNQVEQGEQTRDRHEQQEQSQDQDDINTLSIDIVDWLEHQLTDLFGALKSIHEAAAAGDIELLRVHYLRKEPGTATTPSSISVLDMNGNTPLYHACLNGQDNCVAFLLENGAVTDATSIYAAAAGGFGTVLSRLLSIALALNDASTHHIRAIKRFAQMESTMGTLLNFQSPCNGGLAPLHISCQRGHDQAVGLLLAQPTIKVNLTVGKSCRTPMFLAASAGHHETVMLLLKHPQIVIEMKMPKRMVNITPLWIAAQNDRYRVIFVLLEHMAEHPTTMSVNTQRTDNGQSPIFAAAFRGNHRIVELLANQPSVDVNASDVSGRTPLMVATSSGFTNIARELERRGGLLRDPNRASVGDNMCNIVSMQRKEKRERAANERKKVAQFAQAVRAGDVNFVRTLLNEDVDPPPLVLHLACANRRADVAFALARPIIETGKTDINAGGETSGFTPLYIACAHGHDALVRFLIVQPHIEVNKATTSGQTPLIVGCQNGDTNIVAILLNSPHVDINLRDSSGATALYWASQTGKDEVVELLLFQGRTNKAIANEAGETPRQAAMARVEGGGGAEYAKIVRLLDEERKGWIS